MSQCNATPLQPGIREAARLLGLIVLSCKHVGQALRLPRVERPELPMISL